MNLQVDQETGSIIYRAARRLNTALFCDVWAGWLRAAFFTVAGLVLIYKAFPFLRFDFLGMPGVSYIILGVAILVTVTGSCLAVRGNWFGVPLAAAWMDLHNKAGGRFMAGRPGAACRVAVGVSIIPLFKRCVPGVFFLLAVCLVPEYQPSANGSNSAIQRQIEQLNRKIEQASQVKALSRSVQKQLVKKAESLQKQAQTRPEVAAEGAFSLEKELERQVLATAANSSKQMQKAEEFLRKTAAGAGSEAEVRDLLQAAALAAQQAGGMANLPSDLQNALKQAMQQSACSSLGQCAASGGKGISKETLQRLAKALSKCSSSNLSKMSSAASSLSSSASAALKKMSSGMPGLSKRPFGTSPYKGKVPGPGSGGVNRGPGAAPLVLGKQSNQKGINFKPVEVDNKNGIEPGIKLGSFRSAPEQLKPEEFTGSARNGTDDPVGLGDDAGGALAPSRRKAAEQYFKSLSSGDKE